MTKLTKEEIQKRLEAIEMDDYNDIKTMKELISDIIDTIVPEKKPRTSGVVYKGKVVSVANQTQQGFNEAIDTIHKNKKEILG